MFRFLKRKEYVKVGYNEHQKMVNEIYKKMYFSEYFGTHISIVDKYNFFRNHASTSLDTVKIPGILYLVKCNMGLDRERDKYLYLDDDLKTLIEKVYEKDDVEISKRFIARMLVSSYDTLTEKVDGLVYDFEERSKAMKEKKKKKISTRKTKISLTSF